MTKFEFIQEAALRLLDMQTNATDVTCKAVASAAKKLADEVWEYELEDQRVPQKVIYQMEVAEEDNPYKEYEKLKEEVGNWNGLYRTSDISSVMEALTENVRYVSLTGAKALSLFYGRFNKEVLKNAIDKGEITGIVPETKPVMLRKWDAELREYVTTKRQQRVGTYEVDRLSLFQWLENHYTRRTANGTLINKYIERIIKSK